MNDQPDYGMPIHPVCDLFPLIGGNEFQTLGDDIRANGLVHPIVVHEGQIVDGRNRVLACKDVGVEPRFVEWRQIYKGPMTIAKWIWSVNVERRHLTLDQIVAVQVGIRAWEERQDAAKRQIEAGRQQADRGKEGGRGRKKPLPTNRSEGVSETVPPKRKAPDTRAKLAAEIGASERKVQQALDVQKGAPDLLRQVAQGATSLREAQKKAKATGKAKRSQTKSRAFNLEREIREVMRHVDAALERWGDNERSILLTELIKTLEAMK